MGNRPVPIHYLRGNAAERTPKRFLVFDTETRWVDTGTERTHSLRLWCAELREPDPAQTIYRATATYTGRTAAELGALINKLATTKATLWVYAHNLTFDMAVTALPAVLAAYGWELTQHALGAHQPWARMAKGRKRLVLADSNSLFRLSVEGLGKLVGISKSPLPENDDADDIWQERCQSDVRIVARALALLMEWWQAEQCGNWTLSGAGLGWNFYRHRFPAMGILINPDPDARKLERESIYAGMQYQTLQGTADDGPYAELDFEHAHLTCCAELPLPIRRGRRFERLPITSPWLGRKDRGIVARCLVSATSPRYPVRLGGSVWHPIGEFWTVLAGPEVNAALARGDLLAIAEGYPYVCAPIMQAWGRYVSECLEDPAGRIPAIVYPVIKGWSRTVPGRWALRTGQVVAEYQDPRGGWSIETGWRGPDNARVALVSVGGKMQEVVSDQDGENAFPAVLAWIQSYVRTALADAIEALGGAVVTANTDGLIVSTEALRRQRERFYGPPLESGETHRTAVDDAAAGLDVLAYPLRVRVKRFGESVRIITPMHTTFAGERKFAGIPAGASETEALTYTFWTWPGLAAATRPGKFGRYIQRGRTVHLGDVAVHGWRWADGRVTPIRLELDARGTAKLAQADLQWAKWDQSLGLTTQHPWLRRQLECQS